MMRLILVAFALVALAICLDVVPHGAYCGSDSSLFTIRVDVVSLTAINVNATVLGMPAYCADEAVTYDDSTHVITIPNINKPDDCFNKILVGNGVDPSEITVTFAPANNTIIIDASGATIDMPECTSTLSILNSAEW
eukprot:CAMPEP_0168529436 /NCGR_PEP_ID=MMETSP0405-20121227/13914_1 /TAXON_ID=498012 /ORGANISM="Trichosphaerium sp, Strain Am-I-7 wt" /LENGTH=136 /DNA_ID=CAMNT_0008553173 /DNA_START=1 /DNA_END=408 /DNA_ORIENTATION=+